MDDGSEARAHEFWGGAAGARVACVGNAPPPRRYPVAMTSNSEALSEEEQTLVNTMEIMRSRCSNEEKALDGALNALREHRTREEGMIAQSIATIRGHRNLLAPVMRLPPEILSRIFIFHAQLHRYRSTAVLPSIRVCRRWRQIGLDCPELWSHIDCGAGDSAWMAKMIERSRSVPLSLFMTDPVLDGQNPQKVALVSENMHRFKLLRFYGLDGRIDSLFELFSKPVPLLQSLNLEVVYNKNSTFALPSKFLGGDPPNLRHIKLSIDSFFLWDSLFANLVTLEVEQDTWWAEPDDPGRPPLQMLLSTLARMPGLEVLILRGCVPPPAPLLTVYTHVDLPNLRRLTVEDYLDHCTHFLRQIAVNPSAFVHLILHCTLASKEDVKKFFTVFPSHPYTTSPPTALALKVTWRTSAPDDFKINLWTAEQNMEVNAPHNSSIEVAFRQDPIEAQREITTLDLMWASFAALASPELRSFYVSCSAIPRWDDKFWRRLARVAPDLRRLALTRAPVQSTGLCKALCPPDEQDLVPAECCFPALSYLELAAPYDCRIPMPNGNAPSLSTVLSRCLSARAMIGCSMPELVFTEPQGAAPDGWAQPFRDAVPGIIVRQRL